MEKIVQQIIEQHQELFGTQPAVSKINAGFTNTIFSVADKFILKICHDAGNEEEFAVEIDFYLRNKEKPYMLELLAYSTDKTKSPFYYTVIEKANAPSLYDIWHTFTEEQREEVVCKICNIMKDFHKHKGKSLNWGEYIKGYYEEHLAVLIKQKQLTEDEILLVREAMEKFGFYLKSNDFVLIHNDMHFDNIFYKDGNLKLIDFESSRFNPVDKELEIIYYMAEMPWKHASEENEKFVKAEDYTTLIHYFKKHYPEMFDVPYLEKRIAIYHLRDALDQYGRFTKANELHERIIKLSRFIGKE
ncbi:MAG: aminoglycoside phosphotransferase family protein [Firmicutes bacterium]|nr:aminoglycoside phosphotransferase family protein [Bacillota bacterium]